MVAPARDKQLSKYVTRVLGQVSALYLDPEEKERLLPGRLIHATPSLAEPEQVYAAGYQLVPRPRE